LFEQMVEFRFDAAHALRGYAGKCARLHGHGYRVQVCLQGDGLDELGMLVDFRLVKEACHQVVDELDHRCLNDVAPFDEDNPTCENLARHLHERLADALNNARARVTAVTVWETPTSAVTYRPEALA
jgi:6-pyruvoyltetrahydropterin/6-carboxytetrahydropterin synthase